MLGVLGGRWEEHLQPIKLKRRQESFLFLLAEGHVSISVPMSCPVPIIPLYTVQRLHICVPGCSLFYEDTSRLFASVFLLQMEFGTVCLHISG